MAISEAPSKSLFLNGPRLQAEGVEVIRNEWDVPKRFISEGIKHKPNTKDENGKTPAQRARGLLEGFLVEGLDYFENLAKGSCPVRNICDLVKGAKSQLDTPNGKLKQVEKSLGSESKCLVDKREKNNYQRKINQFRSQLIHQGVQVFPLSTSNNALDNVKIAQPEEQVTPKRRKVIKETFSKMHKVIHDYIKLAHKKKGECADPVAYKLLSNMSQLEVERNYKKDPWGDCKVTRLEDWTIDVCHNGSLSSVCRYEWTCNSGSYQGMKLDGKIFSEICATEGGCALTINECVKNAVSHKGNWRDSVYDHLKENKKGGKEK